MADWETMARRWSKEHIHECCCGGVGYVSPRFPVGHPLFGKAIPCSCILAKTAAKAAEKLRKASGLSQEQIDGFTFSRFDPSLCQPAKTREEMGLIKSACMAYAQDPQGWLVLVGAYGSGKTHLAGAIARVCVSQGKGVFMSTTPDVLDKLRSTYDDEEQDYDEWFDRLKTVDLLVLDDLGAQKASAWANEKLYQIINHRYVNELPMVVTSNVYPTDTEADGRIISRLCQGSEADHGWSHIIRLPCTDLRPYVER